MEKKRKNIFRDLRGESGLVIVEATIVFPVMFFVLFFIIYIGNLYFEQARVDEIVLRYAILGAEESASPFLREDGSISIPTGAKETKIEPYRYIFGAATNGNIRKTEDRISEAVKKEINASSLIFFSNSKANYVGSDNDKIAQYNNHLLYSTFVVQANYKIKFPIRFLGESNPTIISLSSRAEVPVNDTPEFIRNIDMVCDLLEGTKIKETISGFFEKISTVIGKFS